MILVGEFKNFLEQKMNSLEKPKEKENYLDGIHRELSINVNDVPDILDIASMEFPDEGLLFNQVLFKVIKPISLDDHYVKLMFHSTKGPDLNQHVYRKTEDGKVIPYTGTLEGLKTRTFMIPLNKFAEYLSRGWTPTLQSNESPLGGLI